MQSFIGTHGVHTWGIWRVVLQTTVSLRRVLAFCRDLLHRKSRRCYASQSLMRNEKRRWTPACRFALPASFAGFRASLVRVPVTWSMSNLTWGWEMDYGCFLILQIVPQFNLKAKKRKKKIVPQFKSILYPSFLIFFPRRSICRNCQNVNWRKKKETTNLT